MGKCKHKFNKIQIKVTKHTRKNHLLFSLIFQQRIPNATRVKSHPLPPHYSHPLPESTHFTILPSQTPTPPKVNNPRYSPCAHAHTALNGKKRTCPPHYSHARNARLSLVCEKRERMRGTGNLNGARASWIRRDVCTCIIPGNE